ncbi:diguanylate cyclase/phosphodiesterase (GGDEF & EAL domains) with PAS/PAC sensor(s) [hydrothermal vent metagenome]|uniref:histidine kinase n=1 Tax=hydrothermal vent metagenome TaxID=652676 RepID=A0A3B1AND0_9ZZZZ
MDDSTQTRVFDTDSLLQRILTDSFEEIYVFDAATLKFIQVSWGALANLGYSMEEMYSLTAKDLKPDLSEEAFAQLIQPLQTGEKNLLVFETRHQRRDGSRYPVEVRLQLASDAVPPVFIAFVLDQTAHKRARENLQSSERRFRDLVEQSPFSIQMLSSNGRTLAVNPAWERLTGLTIEALKDYNILQDPQLIEKGVIPYIKKGFAGEATEIPPITYDSTETPEIGAPASRFCVRAFIYPIKDENGRVQEVILMHEDVSERERTLLNLRESEARLSEAQRIAHLGSWQLDLGSNELHWSDEVFRIFEIDPQQFGATYEAFFDAIHPDDREQVNAAYLNSLENCLPYEIEHRLQMKDGRVKYVQERCETEFDVDGKPLRSLGTVQDISEYKRAEMTARENEQRFHILAKISPVGIYRTDAQGLCIYVNERWLDMAGMTEPQVLGEDWMKAIHADDRERIFQEWSQAVRTQTPFYTECRLQRPAAADGSQGRVTWVLAQATAERDGVGNIAGYVGTITDISQHKRIEEALGELALAGAGEAFFQRLAQGVATLFNARKAFLCRFLPEQPEVAKNLAVWIRAGSESKGDDCCCLTTTSRAEGFIGTPLLDGAGRTIGIMGIVDDKPLEDSQALRPILEMFAARAAAELERQAAEQAIRHQRDQLEREVQQRTTELRTSNQELESFAYSVSHDLRAPLRAIDGFSLALLEDYGERLDETATGYLQRVRTGTQRMGMLIDDMLQLSQVTRGEFACQPVDLSSLVNSIIRQLQESSPGREVLVSVEPDSVVEGDPRLLGVLLDNLLGNAWKYTSKKDRSRIEFGCIRQDSGQVFFVRDNGVGFNMKYLDKVFAAFQRLHSGSEFEGSGIGLATVQRIANRHGGRVWAEAEEDKGATFYFTLGASVHHRGAEETEKAST